MNPSQAAEQASGGASPQAAHPAAHPARRPAGCRTPQRRPQPAGTRTRGHRDRIGLLAASLGTLAALTAGCSSPAAAPTSVAASPVDARPQDAATVTPTPAASTGAQSCDPTASLRPAGPLPAPGQMPAGSTMARILARGRLIAGVDQNTFLFGYRNTNTGQLEGFDIDMVHAVAKAIFGDPDKIQFRVITSAQRIPAVQSGDVDLVARTMTMNCDRWQQVNFSTVYFQAGQRILVNAGSRAKGIGDLGHQRVCAAAGSTSIQNVAQAPSHPVAVSVQNWTDCLVMLQQGQVDAISTDDAILAGLAAQDPYARVVGPQFSSEPYGLAMRSNNTDFVRFVNGVLERMRADGTWAASYHRWLTPLGPAPAPPVARYKG